MNATASAGKGAATRELILDHAFALARAEGLEGLSIGALAAAVGMSKSGVFAHFGSREELQLAVLDAGARRFVDRVLKPALRTPRGLPRLRAIVARWFEWSREYQSGCVLLSAASEYDGRDGALREGVVRQQAGWRDELRKAVLQAVEEGHLRADLDADQFAFEIYALMLGLHHDAGLFGFDDASRRAAAAFERLWQGWRP
ncbi:TetR/AcrR family transcriptional regulator [Fulvimonas soli]|jgi:AcrR family transcriptional regulator|uniref:TetR family transcriptional regulator n=1 Tax=Fulvimonas soli TaxID=155197 RepID=A0A316I4X3_9GAMM|nr:TetR/AcrR family transcriptional regulator [Fulvimonas soli]PWK87737.1 TetR family transcriptional regulator [Fulvimonas soli]TNY25435.1 TetR family transcriptional regulator [Fulvimonas soli]